jgi:hypothetical protein
MMKKALAAMALAGTAMSAQAALVISEGFSDVAALASKGWISVNAGTAGGGSPGWVQGAATAELFSAQSGAANSYASASFNIAPENGSIDSWLITPVFDATYGATISFYLRAADAAYADQISYGFIGASGALDSTGLTTIAAVPAGEWTRYDVWVGPNAVGAARFAFEYTGTYDSANYVGLDSLSVDVPEPASMALFAGGLLGLGAIRRRSRA